MFAIILSGDNTIMPEPIQKPEKLLKRHVYISENKDILQQPES